MTQAADTKARTAELQGLVDNATATHLYGWAWNAARPEERVAVELRLGEEVVARTVASRERHDLVKAGIGDGRHAFELPLKRDWVERRSELAVIACAEDGSESGLALRVRRTDVDPRGDMQRVLEATASAHRQLREELRELAGRMAAGAAPGEQEALLRRLAESDVALHEKLDTLTLWLMRLDERLAVLPMAPPPVQAAGWGRVGATLCAVLLVAGLGTAALLLRG